ncbi:hypothetical protein R5R35_009216 [Gryllus longicercus]|uniref:Uncharacterized protein n=1 Tax=Gryllus longicercus TaxID=2509291 RepID=A0AAN9V614_9ORTH
MGPKRRRGDALSVSLAAALAPVLAPAATPPPSPSPRSPPPQPEWARLTAAVSALFAAPPPQPGADVFGAPGRLRAMQAEVRALLRGRAAALVPDFLRGRVLPAAMRALAAASAAALADDADADDAGDDAPAPDDVEVVLEAWARLWRHLLPALLAVFVHVRTAQPGVRALALLAFRDEVLLEREAAVGAALCAPGAAGAAARARLAQPLLVTAQAAALGPAAPAPGAAPAPAGAGASAAAARLLGPAHAHACLRVEALLARCVSPLLGARGLYEDFAPAPVVPAQPAPLRPHNRSGRKMLRPLSVAAGQRLHTLSDLFAAAVAAHVHGGHAHARLDA